MLEHAENNEKCKELTFSEIIPIINDKYLTFINHNSDFFKYHEQLKGPLEYDLKSINEKLSDNHFHIMDILTDNFLFCLEQVFDHNSDYFIYQKETIPKKNGKVYKNKLPKIGSKTLLKRLLKESDKKNVEKIFSDISDIFNLLTIKDNMGTVFFNKDYISYVKDHFTENKNFSKMIMVFDNIDNIVNIDKNNEEEVENNTEAVENITEALTVKSKLKNKSKGKNKVKSDDFMKGLENTKIAQLAKNISEKINPNEFPDLNDPSKLLSSLGNPSSDENGGIQNLLKFVVGEVEQAFKNNDLNEKELIGEAQNIMGQFQNMSGFDPISLFKNNENLDMSQFADIFSKMKK
jgi:virulence-associated protein VapD